MLRWTPLPQRFLYRVVTVGIVYRPAAACPVARDDARGPAMAHGPGRAGASRVPRAKTLKVHEQRARNAQFIACWQKLFQYSNNK